MDRPDICIVVEIIRTVCCIGVVTEFYQRRKYNLLELVKETPSVETDNPVEAAEAEGEN